MVLVRSRYIMLIIQPTYVAPPNQEDQMSHIMKHSPYQPLRVNSPPYIYSHMHINLHQLDLKYTKPQLSVK